MDAGDRLFDRGAFDQAISNWSEAARLYEKSGNSAERCDALIKLSRAYHAIGQYAKALEVLQTCLGIAEKSMDQVRVASIMSSMGDSLIVIGPHDKAHQYLTKALAIAGKTENAALSATILNNLGNLFTSQKQYEQAIAAYAESAALAKKSNNPSLTAITLINATTASMESGDHSKARSYLDEALEHIRALENSHNKAHGLINIGLGYYRLRSFLPEDELLFTPALQAFNEAIVVSEAIDNPRVASYAWGYLGSLYEDKNDYETALQLTREAIFAAQQVDAQESLYRWQWQAGRLLKTLKRMDDAILAYRRAVSALQSIREEMSNCYGKAQVSFRQSAEPLYLGFVDLLLQRAASINERAQVEPYLKEARESWEQVKAFELRDYFNDECIDAMRSGTTQLDLVSKKAAVVYPILLQDRIELLVSLPEGMQRIAVSVGMDTVTQEVRSFRKKLEKLTTREYLPHAQQLYDWLIRPLDADLQSAMVDTLVFVPDGPLRTIPMAALHDGDAFLISKYAVAITPGLDLTDPRSIQREDMKVLAFGLTKSVQGFPSLPYVSEELNALQDQYRSKLLLNEGFQLSTVEKLLNDESFTIVHIASHGRFEGKVEDSYLLTFDGKLTMDHLDQYVGLFRFRKRPLELLTLSGCSTASGDDRAALGLAGIAVKTGARSALATLWHIHDEASSLLVKEFYRQLKNPSVSRAVALQRAQEKLMEDHRYRHAGYWSPFLLINNWL